MGFTEVILKVHEPLLFESIFVNVHLPCRLQAYQHTVVHDGYEPAVNTFYKKSNKKQKLVEISKFDGKQHSHKEVFTNKNESIAHVPEEIGQSLVKVTYCHLCPRILSTMKYTTDYVSLTYKHPSVHRFKCVHLVPWFKCRENV